MTRTDSLLNLTLFRLKQGKVLAVKHYDHNVYGRRSALCCGNFWDQRR